VFYFLNNTVSSDNLISIEQACEHYLCINSVVEPRVETVQYNKFTKIVFNNFSELLNCTTSVVEDYGIIANNSEQDHNKKINYFLHEIQKNIEFIEFSYRIQEGIKCFKSFMDNTEYYFCSSLFEVNLNSMKFQKNILVLSEYSEDKCLSLKEHYIMELLEIIDYTTLIVKEVMSSYKVLSRLCMQSSFKFKEDWNTSFTESKSNKKDVNWYGLLALEECEVRDISKANVGCESINLLNENFNIRKGNFALIDSSFSFTISTNCVVFLIKKLHQQEQLSTASASCEISDRGFSSMFLNMNDSESPSNSESNHSEIDISVSNKYEVNTTLSSTQQDVMLKKVATLNQADNEAVDFAFKNMDSDIKMRESSGKIQMTVEKFRCLMPKKWLNSEVINFYMDLLQDKDTKIFCMNFKKKTSHFFNTFFMSKLLPEKNKYNFEDVKRWTKYFKVFEQDKIFIPININNNHWFLVVIYIEQKQIIYYDSIANNDRATLYLFTIAKWLKDEAKSKNEDININDWTLIDTGKNIPQQSNGYDCGVYLILNADYIADDLPLSYGEEQIKESRNKIAYYYIINNKLSP